MALVLLFLYVPIFVLIVFSFNETKSRSVFSGFTLDWYARLFHNRIIISSLVNTIIIAVAASIVSTVLGTFAAIGINGMRKVPKAVVMNVTNMPIINPEIVTGVSLMLLFVFFAARMNLEFGFVTLVIAHITFDVPYVILNVMPKFNQMDPHLYEAPSRTNNTNISLSMHLQARLFLLIKAVKRICLQNLEPNCKQSTSRTQIKAK